MRLKDLFFRPKGPGFGISENYYISVLSSAAVLPSMRDLVQPKPDREGVLTGFGAPLSQENASPELLAEPLKRGAYALATTDRKTLIRMLVMGIDEANFDPKAYAESSEGALEDPELIARMRGAWTVTQFSFQSHAPDVFSSLLFLWQFAARLAELGDGVVADPLSERYRLPSEAYHDPQAMNLPGAVVDPRDLVDVKRVVQPEGLYVYTLGMQKLGLPEIELSRLEIRSEASAILFMLGLVSAVLGGTKLGLGHQVGSTKFPFTVAVGGLDRARWEGRACVELLPPTHMTSSETLDTWVAEENN